MIHVFHGFLGSPEDFSFLGKDVLYHDLYSEEAPGPRVRPEDTLIGYSMGGRIALGLAQEASFKTLILINAHPGLRSEEARRARRSWEDGVLEKLRTLDQEAFLDYWNRQEIFQEDRPLTGLHPGRYEKSAELFDRYRLSDQPDFLPSIEEHKHKITWIVGLKDAKYRDLAKTVLEPIGVRGRYVSGGHRLFQTPEALLDCLREEKLL